MSSSTDLTQNFLGGLLAREDEIKPSESLIEEQQKLGDTEGESNSLDFSSQGRPYSSPFTRTYSGPSGRTYAEPYE
jgi:hypothetical protein